MKIDPQRMSQLWHLLEAAEARFCGRGEFSYQGALHSFSVGLRGVMQRAGEGVDIIEAKRYFSVLLKEKLYAIEISDPADVGIPMARMLRDDRQRVPDSLMLALGRSFPAVPRPPRGDGVRDHSTQFPPLVDDEKTRSLIDSLIADTKLYATSKAVKDLFNFTARMRHIAPFNAMLLNAQKPGLSYAATVRDWAERFGRYPKARARPLIVLRNFGPVDFVYDVLDTEGRPLPEAAFSFPTTGDIPRAWFRSAEEHLEKAAIKLIWADEGDRRAGCVWQEKDHNDKTRLNDVSLVVNANHPPATQFVTLVHELAHLYLGHLGIDRKRGVDDRRWADLALREVEAESVAYVIAKRSGISPRSESYLSRYKGAFDTFQPQVVLQAANAIERLLRLPFASWPAGANGGQMSFNLGS